MSHTVTITELFLIAMLIIFTVPYLIWRVFRTDYWAPLVVVQILTGILLGPGVLGAAFPDYYAFVFRPEVIQALNGVAWWAVMMFVWFAGVELDLNEAWRRKSETGLTAGLALVTPLLFGAGAAAILLATGDGWAGPKGEIWQVVLGIGMACAVTALPILILFMDRLEILRRPLGQRVLRYASLDDIAIWAVLALVLLDWERVGRQGAFLIGFAAAALAMRRLMPRLVERDRWFDQTRMDQFRDTVLMTVMPVFFLSTGLRTTWDVGGVAVFGAAALLLAAAVGGKLAGVHLAGRLLKWGPGEASVIGWLLQTKALIMIIFANILLDKQIITSGTFTALLLMAVGSTMLTIPMVTPRLRRATDIIGKGG
ncbi:MAG: cation:proton antiporter [Brevundimonas sp.]